MDPGFIASNSVDVNIEDDEEPYFTARAVDSDDNRPVAPLSETRNGAHQAFVS